MRISFAGSEVISRKRDRDAHRVQGEADLAQKANVKLAVRELLSAWASTLPVDGARFEDIVGFYDPKRLHSTLGRLSPLQFEESRLG